MLTALGLRAGAGDRHQHEGDYRSSNEGGLEFTARARNTHVYKVRGRPEMRQKRLIR